MKIQILITLAFIGFVISCSTPPAYIIPTDFEAMFAAAKAGNGVTEREADSLNFQIAGLLQSNTEGKSLPNVKVTDLENREVNLRDQLTAKTIILSSNIHCAMAMECLLYEYPKIMAGLQANQEIAPTVCLIVKTEFDAENEQEFNAAVAGIKPHYQKLYVISEKEARKMNLHFGTTRLYVNEAQVVEHMVLGNCNAEKLEQEIFQQNF